MSSAYPSLVIALTHHHDGWIVGSAANPSTSEPRDIDVMVPLSHWQSAASLIPKDAKVNTFGGWKCRENGVEIDVWPGELGWVMQHPKAMYAFHPRSGTRLQRSNQ